MFSKIKKLLMLFVFVLIVSLACGCVNADPIPEVPERPPSSSVIKLFKFSVSNPYYNKVAKIKVKLIGKDNKPVKNMGLFLTKVTNKLTYPGVDIGYVKTNSRGIATFKNKLTEFGYNNILFESNEYIYSDGRSEGTYSLGIFVYKSFLKQSNKVFVKNHNIGMKSYFKLKGPKSSTFKVYYKIPKGFKYFKPKIKGNGFKSVKVRFNHKKRIVVLKVNKLKPKKSVSVKWKLYAKSGNFTIKSVVKKPKSTKFRGNNVLKKIKV